MFPAPPPPCHSASWAKGTLQRSTHTQKDTIALSWRIQGGPDMQGRQLPRATLRRRTRQLRPLSYKKKRFAQQMSFLCLFFFYFLIYSMFSSIFSASLQRLLYPSIGVLTYNVSREHYIYHKSAGGAQLGWDLVVRNIAAYNPLHFHTIQWPLMPHMEASASIKFPHILPLMFHQSVLFKYSYN